VAGSVQQVHQFVCLYGHFYQPPREDPFTGRIPREPGAAPFENFNEKITAECYRPNAVAGNFEHISFDLGPTLAAWLEQAHPEVYTTIVEADRRNVERYGIGNALAQAYNHTILPLASTRDKRTQIRWGLQDFAQRFGRRAEGLWLAETAIDLETLDTLACEGVEYTVLAPWQAARPIDPTEPYLVRLPEGRGITAFFYNGPLSGGVSFDWDMTSNADNFAAASLPAHLNRAKAERGEDQLITIATDGELYGHHKPWRDQFLAYLVREGARKHGFDVTSLGRYLRTHPARREMTLHVPSAWSCAHGVARWGTGCSCTDGDSSWKPALRRALDGLAAGLNETFERATSLTLADPWAARDDYLALRNRWLSLDDFWARHGVRGQRPEHKTIEVNTLQLLEAQYFGQWMYTSCGFFFEDLDRIEPRNDIAFARRAISLVWQATRRDLQTSFVRDLAVAKSWRTGLTGADLYRQLPIVQPGQLPTFGGEKDESAA
jgi:alpha-amylase/alpha-mannosidase (GH57 family)